MNWRRAVAAAVAVVLVICAGLALSNPTLSQYQQSILMPLAELDAEDLAQADRRTIEKEAAMISSLFAAVHYDAHKLDAAIIQENHPWLGVLVTQQEATDRQTFPERLAVAKQRAYSKVDLLRQTVLYEVLGKLSTQTTRTSHGLWSTFETCVAGKALSYTGVAGMFYERSERNCPVNPSEK